jgi:hypothetical protein
MNQKNVEVYFMLKNDLRQNGFADYDITPKQWKITLLWVILTMNLMVGTVIAAFYFDKTFMIGPVDPFAFITQPLMAVLAAYSAPFMGFLIYFLVPLLIYFAIKCLLTILVCKDKNQSIKLKLLKNKGMPICACKEALTVRQTMLIYLVPFIFMYAVMLALCVLEGGEAADINIYSTITLLLSFFWAFDLTLMLYVLYIKIKHKAEYIAVDYHVYMMTIFSKSYVKARKKRN